MRAPQESDRRLEGRGRDAAAKDDRSRKLRRGWVRIYRSLIDSPFFDDAELFRLVIYLILRANHRERIVRVKTGRGLKEVAVGVGQTVVGMPSLAAKMRTPKTSCKRRLLKLEAVGFVALQTHRHFTIVTLLNWQTYNPSKVRPDKQSGATNGATSGATTGATNGHKQEQRNKNYLKNQSNKKRPADAASGSVSGVQMNLTLETLRSFDDLRAWFDQESARDDGWVKGSDVEWQNVKATAAKALSDSAISNPVGFAKDTIRGRHWDRLGSDHDERAKAMEQSRRPSHRPRASGSEPHHLGDVLAGVTAVQVASESLS